MSVASAKLPVIGKSLEPLGAVTAMGIWGYRHVPEFFGSGSRSRREPDQADVRKQELASTNSVIEAALRGVVSPTDLAIEWPAPERYAPCREDAAAPPQPASGLGALRRPPLPVAGCVAAEGIAGRTGPGDDLRSRRCVDSRWQAAAGVRVDVASGSAGLGVSFGELPGFATQPVAAAHHRREDRDRMGTRECGPVRRRPQFRGDSGLFGRRPPIAAWPGLTPNDPEMQADLAEGSDTSVDAVVGIYGRYDWEDRSTPERDRFVDFLERVVVKRKIDRHPEIFRKASPIAQVHPDAPPFLVIHGSGDSRHPRRAGPQLRRAAARGVSFGGELPRAARRRSRFRHD